MSEIKKLPVLTVKSENFFSTDATEYQYFPYKLGNENHVALTFFRGDVEADLSKEDPGLLAVRKAVCTISINFDVAKLLANQLNYLVNSQAQNTENNEQRTDT